ncbi:MAG: hypothetical protein GYB65_23875, partial [Chloroflexi bacterium]|nr:hypothetical protein [Chloroflexota bacterium]
IRRLWTLALLLALAAISKLSGLALYPIAGLVVLLVAWREREQHAPFRRLLVAGVIVVGVWSVVAGWWYWRNWRLYDDPTGTNVMIDIIGARDETPDVAELLDEFEGLRKSFWGVFGTLNVSAPDALFWYGDALSLLALAGLLVYSFRAVRGHTPARESLPLLFLALQVLVVFAALVNWTRRTPATQGRLLFPVLGALSLLAAVGLGEIVRLATQVLPPHPHQASHTHGPRLAVVFAMPLVLAAAILPIITIQPTYQPPETVSTLPDDAVQLPSAISPIQLRGVHIADEIVRPGDSLEVTLYWHPTAHTANDLSLYVLVFGQETDDGIQLLGKLDSYPGGGLLRTTTWDLDQTYADTYRIEIDENTRAPVRPRLEIGWWRYAPGAIFDPDRSPVPPVQVEGGRIVGENQRLESGEPVDAVFGDMLRLNRARITSTTLPRGVPLSVDLEWEALRRPNEDFQVLVHLVDPDQPDLGLANGDHSPLNRRWPTSAWEPGHSFVNSVTLVPDVPPGEYRLLVGFYRLDDFTRLPVEAENPVNALPDRVYLPQTITITAGD